MSGSRFSGGYGVMGAEPGCLGGGGEPGTKVLVPVWCATTLTRRSFSITDFYSLPFLGGNFTSFLFSSLIFYGVRIFSST